MSKHTPGPWHVSASYSDTCDWEVVSETDVIAGEYGIESADDARLIAAAPDLLEACKVASALLKGLPRSLGYDFDATQLDVRAVVDELRALGWTFVAARDRVACQHYAMQDQADTRKESVWFGNTPVGCEVAMRILDIGMRRESGA